MECHFLLFAVSLLMGSTVANTTTTDLGVVKLDGDTFASSLQNSHNFVMFYAPWCGHCQNLKPVWEELANKFHTDVAQEKLTVAKVDCTSDAELCSQHEVTGYPTLKLFVKGSSEVLRYRGQRDLASLVDFVNQSLGSVSKEEAKEEVKPATSVVGAIELTESTFKDHVAVGPHFIKFYAPWCGHCQKLSPTWDNLAKSVGQDTSVTIGKVDCTQHRILCNEFDVKGYPTLLWIQDGKKVEKYQGSRTHEDLKAFLERMKNDNQPDLSSNDVPNSKDDKVPPVATSAVVQLVDSNFENGIATGLTFVKFYAPWCGHCKRLSPTWDELATKVVGMKNIKIGKVDCTEESNRKLCASQKVNGFPTLFLYSEGKQVEEYDGDRSLDDMFSFLSKHITQQPGKDEL